MTTTERPILLRPDRFKRAEMTEMMGPAGFSAQFLDHEGKEVFVEAFVYHGKTPDGNALRIIGIGHNKHEARKRREEAVTRAIASARDV